jgi:hypothetical protein
VRSLFRRCGLATSLAAVALAVAPGASANPSEIYASDACSPSFNVAHQNRVPGSKSALGLACGRPGSSSGREDNFYVPMA